MISLTILAASPVSVLGIVYWISLIVGGGLLLIPTLAGVSDSSMDADGAVDVDDLVELLLAWGPCGGGDCPADLDGDGAVTVQDLLKLLVSWG